MGSPRHHRPDSAAELVPGPVPGAIASPNIWHHLDAYEVENRAFDRPGTITDLIGRLAPWAGRHVLDIGCGTGFHLPVFARTAAEVTGVEPHGDLAAIARRRARRHEHVTVLQATADDLPLPDDSVDVVHARWAYFFGPGCEPGLDELARVVRAGGRAVIIDNDASRSTFGSWFRRGYPQIDHEAVVAFWTDRGWERHPVQSAWTFDSREDLESVVRIEFAPGVAEETLAGHEGTAVDYAVNVWSRSY